MKLSATRVNAVRKLCIIVLGALVLMAVASPMLQFDSLDSFPVSSDDIELLVMFCLCLAGMVLVFAHLVKLTRTFSRIEVQVTPSHLLSAILLSVNMHSETFVLMSSPPPLRI